MAHDTVLQSSNSVMKMGNVQTIGRAIILCSLIQTDQPLKVSGGDEGPPMRWRLEEEDSVKKFFALLSFLFSHYLR